MTKSFFISILAFFFIHNVNAQVGIGTTNPNPSSILDIQASNKGLLVPRVSLNNVTNAQLDGVNTAETSLLIYNTNASTIGGTGAGYYYFEGLKWVKLITSDTNVSDNLGNHNATTTLDLNSNEITEVSRLSMLASSDYDKLRVYNSSAYTLGMHSAMTFGYLNSWATTFTMGNNANTGWLFRDTADAQSDGAMSLTTNGRMTLKNYLSIPSTTDATGAVNTGALQIGNKLRLDSDEMLTNTNTVLYLQNGNNGDLRVDGTTLAVDASTNRVGLGVTAPTQTLDVNGGVRIRGGNPAVGKILTSNANGTATWQTPAMQAGDNLGNHNATTTLDLNSNQITEVSRLSMLATSDYDKLRVFSSDLYTFGMHSAMSYGFLNDWATTFTMNDDIDRGWVFRANTSAQNDGAMSLTTDGRMTVKKYLSIPSTTDATGAVNTGVLQIGNKLRLDGDEMLTNTNTVLYLQNGNNGDLRVDGNTLAVDASTNRVGVGVTAPTQTLDVNGVVRIRGGNPALGKVLTSSANGTASWETPIVPVDDIDWYKESTTAAPTNINDNIYTQGNVAIGKMSAYYKLDIEETTGTRGVNIELSGANNGTVYGSYLDDNNSGTGDHYGYYSRLDTNTGDEHFGTFNHVWGANIEPAFGTYNDVLSRNNSLGPIYGTFNDVTGQGSEVNYGTYNELRGYGDGDHYGTYNDVSGNGGGSHFGTYNEMSWASGGSVQYGVYNYLHSIGSGTKYGIYSDVDTAVGNYAGYFVGNVYSSGTYLPSARILKSNIKPLKSVLDKLMNLDVKSYTYKTKEYDFMNLPKGTQSGFIAEELEKEFPELVTKTIHPESPKELEKRNDKESEKKTIRKPNDKVEFKAVNYTGLVPHLIKGIQEQQVKIEAQQSKIDYLEKELQEIKALLKK